MALGSLNTTKGWAELLAEVRTEFDKWGVKDVDDVGRVASATVQTHRSAGKVVLFGNGGSSCDAQHIAAEMSPEELLRGNVNLK